MHRRFFIVLCIVVIAVGFFVHFSGIYEILAAKEAAIFKVSLWL